jgi:predicted amidophosphoribosyltransferase
VAWRQVLDLLFPSQCASCNALGAGLCDACAPHADPIRIRFPTLCVTAFGAYEGSLRAAVVALKDGRRDVAETLGRMVACLVQRHALLVPIPTTASRRRVRGIDGVALVAHCAAALRDAQVVAALELQSPAAQRGRSRTQRLAARGRFACNPAAVGARRVTLFDDVCTTGSTLRDCADAVREAGGLVEDAVVVAVTKSHQPWRIPIVN